MLQDLFVALQEETDNVQKIRLYTNIKMLLKLLYEDPYAVDKRPNIMVIDMGVNNFMNINVEDNVTEEETETEINNLYIGEEE